MPFVDSDIDQILWYHAPAKIPPQPNYLTLIFSETAALCVIACQIAEVVCVLSLIFSSTTLMSG
jgi:hypothetical protein